jgi:hypothetical protein
VGTRSLSSGARWRDPLALPTLRICVTVAIQQFVVPANAGTTGIDSVFQTAKLFLLPSPRRALARCGEGSGVGASPQVTLPANFAEAPPTPAPSPPRASRAGGRGADTPPRSRDATRARFARISRTPNRKGRRECRMPSAPAASRANISKARKHIHHRFTGITPAFPARWC